MGASEDESVDLRVETHDMVDAFFHKIVGTGTVGLVIFDYWHPQRACDAGDGDVGPQFLYLHIVALTSHRSLSGEQSYVARDGQIAYNFGRRTYNTKYAARWVEFRQVALLDAPESLC